MENLSFKLKLKSFIFYQIFVRLMILYVTVDFVLLCPLLFSDLWDLNETINDYEQTLIMDISLVKKNKNLELINFGEWKGTGKGCDCTLSELYNYNIYKGLCNQIQINGKCKRVYSVDPSYIYKIYNTFFYQDILKRNYLDLLKQISSFDKNKCEGSYKKCGILDNLNNPLCIENENECPINDIVINNNKSLEGYKTIKFKEKNLYLHYTNKKTDNMIITKIYFSSESINEGNDTKQIIDDYLLYKYEDIEENFTSKLIYEFPKIDIYKDNEIIEKTLHLNKYDISNETLYLRTELGFINFNRDNENFKYMFIIFLVHPRIYIISTIVIIIVLDYYYGFYLLKNDSKGQNCHLYLGIIIHSIIIILKGYFVKFWKIFMYLCIQEPGGTAEYGKVLTAICLSLSCVIYINLIIMIILGLGVKKNFGHRPMRMEIMDSKEFDSNNALDRFSYNKKKK